MDLKGLVEYMVQTGAFTNVVSNPLAQFGQRPAAPFLFADLLPEKPVPVNDYTEEGIRYRTVVANAGTRYSPAQKKKGTIVGAMRVSLGYSDIAAELDGAEYDALIRAIEQFTGTAGVLGGDVGRPAFAATLQILDWVETQLHQPLLVHNEKNRADALVLAQVTLTGDNGFREVVNYPNPSGARVNAGGTWSNDSYDPWADIIARQTYLANKGYKIGRIITRTPVMSILRNNAKVKLRAGMLNITDGVIAGVPGAVTVARLNELAQADGLPPFEVYDRVYYTQSSYGNILQSDAMVFVSTTGRDMRVDRGDLEPVVVGDTLGYTAVGRAAGQAGPGRVIPAPRVITDSKPPRVEGEGWQASCPVVTDPEAVSVITSIA